MSPTRPRTRALVVRTAATNCEGETVRALRLAGADAELVHLNALLREPQRLAEASIFVVPGGFSYGDYVAAGRVFGYELQHGLAGELRAFVDAGGLVLGVCNGFQVLVETGLLERQEPQVSAGVRRIALTGNASGRFECRWVTLQSEDSACPWLVPGELMPVPVAHAEGRFLVRDAATLEDLRERRQIALRYVSVDAEGRVSEAAYPDDPNGSVEQIAGVCDSTGRVLGLMPHPERNLTPWEHPTWTRLGPRSEGEGLNFYRRMVEAASSTALTSHPDASRSTTPAP